MSQRLERRKKKKLVMNHPDINKVTEDVELETVEVTEEETQENTQQFFKIVGVITLVVLILLYFMYQSSL